MADIIRLNNRDEHVEKKVQFDFRVYKLFLFASIVICCIYGRFELAEFDRLV